MIVIRNIQLTSEPFMENLENSMKRTYRTGFNLFPEDNDCGNSDEISTDFLEADYVGKLRSQRERMEKLEQCYAKKQKQLDREVEKTTQLLAEVQKLAAYVPYKQHYQQLQSQCNKLEQRLRVKHAEASDLESQLNKRTSSASSIIGRLKQEIKIVKEQFRFSVDELNEIIGEKDNQIRKLRQKEPEVAVKIKDMEKLIGKMEEESKARSFLFEKEEERLKLKDRQMAIRQLESLLESAYTVNSKLQNDLIHAHQQASKFDKEVSAISRKHRQELSEVKKVITAKNQKIEVLEQELKKSEKLGADLRVQVSALESEYGKICEKYENDHRKLAHESKLQIQRLETFIEELKSSVEELMEVKNNLLEQNMHLVSILKKKQHLQRQRKQLILTEFKQIDRIQKVIDRLQ